MTLRLNHLDPRMRPVPKPVPDMTAQFDALLNMASAKLNDRAELKREIIAAMSVLEDNIKAYINAIPLAPPPDLGPVLAAASKTQEAVQSIRFPEIPTPESVDFSPVTEQINALIARVEVVSDAVAAIPTDLPEISVNAAPAKEVVQSVVEPRPRHWTFKVTRNPRGFDVDAQAVD